MAGNVIEYLNRCYLESGKYVKYKYVIKHMREYSLIYSAYLLKIGIVFVNIR